MSLKSSNKQELSEIIKAEAKNLGFFACGIAQADRVDEATACHVRRWLDAEYYAGMAYMNNYTDRRLDPRLLMDGLKSIVCVALNYAPAHDFEDGELRFAAYALGQDYHDIVKNKLRELADKIGVENYRVFCDSAPVLERYWAAQAGLGWIGKNHQLIIPHAGSMFFLGELFLDIELEYDEPAKNRCGNCHRCIDNCPTGALQEGKELNALACLSYQTIENRNDIPQKYACKMGETIYGCDRCQQVCPWNRFAHPNDTPELQPKEELLRMKRGDWINLSEEDYRKLFKGSAVKRAKYAGLMRNIKAATCDYEGNELTLDTKQQDDE
ncbi:putative iron-sulfur cluster-binding protein [Prevotella sp. DNF00663]|uniref:tRNA epoxyqueuosine(34) reductase QueG n=1 Tax=Prevotella sp. DNF00663 TaxID=1384078 RepID=UPI00078658C6|nr:tRNA epoxyqueuosine(34) reductase QueG [Prevotella sp. DNF00663]KXB85196.1 putative iron-sulfur cluster-binding protein [Prevotella sp. DNF00663]